MLIAKSLLFLLILSAVSALLIYISMRQDSKRDSRSDWDIIGSEFIIFRTEAGCDDGNETVVIRGRV